MRVIFMPAMSRRGEDHFLVLSQDGREATVVRTSTDGEVLMAQAAEGVARVEFRRVFEGAIRRRQARFLTQEEVA
jgi:hypothetical protein